LGPSATARGALKLQSVDNSFDRLPVTRPDCINALAGAATGTGAIMAKRKKGSKVQKRGKLRTASRGKARKGTKAALAKATKRTVAKAKPKPAPAKKAVQKVKQPVAPAVETVAVEVIEQPAPGVITVTEVEGTEVRQAS
jgi:hypothetical protein